jgi:IS30 family transposase
MASHGTIHRFVHGIKRREGDFHKRLRRIHRCRSKRRNPLRNRGHITERVGIEKRPPAVDRQNRFGDWEGDIILEIGLPGCHGNHDRAQIPLNQTSYDRSKDIQNKRNIRPRKKPKLKTPNEVFHNSSSDWPIPNLVRH